METSKTTAKNGGRKKPSEPLTLWQFYSFLLIKREAPKKSYENKVKKKHRQFINNEYKLSSPTKQIFDSLLHHPHSHASGAFVYFFFFPFRFHFIPDSLAIQHKSERKHGDKHTNMERGSKTAEMARRSQNGRDKGKKNTLAYALLNYSNAN